MTFYELINTTYVAPNPIVAIPTTETIDTPYFGTLHPWGRLSLTSPPDRRTVSSLASATSRPIRPSASLGRGTSGQGPSMERDSLLSDRRYIVCICIHMYICITTNIVYCLYTNTRIDQKGRCYICIYVCTYIYIQMVKDKGPEKPSSAAAWSL